jgi:ParB family chromosome partitioning protein
MTATTTRPGAEATFAAALHRRETKPTILPQLQKQLIGRRKDTQAFTLAAERIRVDADQVRKNGKSADDAETKELAASIEALGVMNPITVRYLDADDVYEIIAGERRYLAMTRILNWEEVPVRVVDKSEDDVLWLQIHENIHRKQLDALELEEAIRRAMTEGGLSMDQVADKLKKSVSYVQKFVTVADKLTPAARNELDRYRDVHPGKKLAIDVVYEVATVPAAAQEELSKAVVEENLARTEARKRAGAIKLAVTKSIPKDAPKKAGRPRVGKPYSKTFKAANGAAVTVEFKKGKPAEVEAELVAALNDVLERLR